MGNWTVAVCECDLMKMEHVAGLGGGQTCAGTLDLLRFSFHYPLSDSYCFFVLFFNQSHRLKSDRKRGGNLSSFNDSHTHSIHYFIFQTTPLKLSTYTLPNPPVHHSFMVHKVYSTRPSLRQSISPTFCPNITFPAH